MSWGFAVFATPFWDTALRRGDINPQHVAEEEGRKTEIQAFQRNLICKLLTKLRLLIPRDSRSGSDPWKRPITASAVVDTRRIADIQEHYEDVSYSNGVGGRRFKSGMQRWTMAVRRGPMPFCIRQCQVLLLTISSNTSNRHSFGANGRNGHVTWQPCGSARIGEQPRRPTPQPQLHTNLQLDTSLPLFLTFVHLYVKSSLRQSLDRIRDSAIVPFTK